MQLQTHPGHQLLSGGRGTRGVSGAVWTRGRVPAKLAQGGNGGVTSVLDSSPVWSFPGAGSGQRGIMREQEGEKARQEFGLAKCSQTVLPKMVATSHMWLWSI